MDESLEAANEFLLISGGEFRVLDVAVIFLVFEAVDHRLKRIVVFAFALLHADDNVAVHLNEAAVAIPGKTLVLSGGREGENRLVVKTKIEDGIHHARHGIARARAHGYEEGKAGGVTELVAHDFLHILHAGFHLGLKRSWIGAFIGVKIGANLRRDGEAGRHGEADAGHLREIGALAPEEVLHGTIAIGLAGAPGVDAFERLAFGGGFRSGFLGSGLFARGLLSSGFLSHVIGGNRTKGPPSQRLGAGVSTMEAGGIKRFSGA